MSGFTRYQSDEKNSPKDQSVSPTARRRDLGFRGSAAKLYQLLLKPAEAQLRGKTNIVIVPDQTVWDLPFQALITAANRYLIEDASISYAPSLTVLREVTRRRRDPIADDDSLTLLAVGNPASKTGDYDSRVVYDA